MYKEEGYLDPYPIKIIHKLLNIINVHNFVSVSSHFEVF
jgi:hypothetical protein